MDCDDRKSIVCDDGSPSLSYFLYGSIGCFCYGEIHHNHGSSSNHVEGTIHSSSSIFAFINNLIDIKEDNSRVSCIRFLKNIGQPLAMVLTENGSLLIHDCLSKENLVHFKKTELISKLIGETSDVTRPADQHCNKKAKYNVTQQINSFVWPKAKHAFIGISLLRLKKNQLHWLKIKDFTDKSINRADISKSGFIESHEVINIGNSFNGPICCMESSLIGNESCLIAVGMDDGLIVVIKVDLSTNKISRTTELSRHNDQICALSIYSGDDDRFSMGLLASASRGGLVLLWDVENEFYFADYQALPDGKKSHINWFALKLISSIHSKSVHLAVSNCDSGITILEVPEKTKTKIRLKDNKDKKDRHPTNDSSLKHHALIFDIIYDPLSDVISTSSLDGNHIFWSCLRANAVNKVNKRVEHLRIRPEYLLTSMHNNARGHMMRHNPIKEDFMGLALGKAGLRFYKVPGSPAQRRFDMSSSCASVARKLNKASLSPTSLSWCPGNEYKLAVGTLEGKILQIDLAPSKASVFECKKRSQVQCPKILDSSEDPFGVEYRPVERDLSIEEDMDTRQTKNDGIYSLCWGPDPRHPNDLSRLSVYAVGSISHRLFIFSNPGDGDELFDYIENYADHGLPEALDKASEISWKSNFDLMALGTTEGRVIIVRYCERQSSNQSETLFTRLAVIDGPLGNSYIQCLAWHPTADIEDSRYYYIAASSNESPLFVFNIKENLLVADVEERLVIDEQQADTKSNTDSISTHLYKMDEHKKAISDVSWSPHEPNQLATASFDRNCFVWSLGIERSLGESDARIIAKFSGRDRLFTVDWSLVDADLIFTSGHDNTIWAWRPSENP